MVAIFPLPRPYAIRFPRSNRQISKSPISSAFSGRYFSLAAAASDFPSQIVKSPQVLSHLLSVVAIFPLPHPCAIRFPKSNRQTPTVLSHLLCSGRYSAFSHFTSFSCCVSCCASPLGLPGEAFSTADRPARSEQ